MKNILYTFCFAFLPFLIQAQCNTASIYANTTSNAVCFDTTFSKVRNCYSNNYPDHDDSYNSPFTLTATEEEYSMCLYPDTASSFTPLYETTETSVGCTDIYTFGVGTNGVKYDPSSAVYFENTSTGENNIEWHVEARYIFSGNFGNNGGHLNPFGEYHYHDVPSDYFADSLNINIAEHSPIVGWAADGFPMYYKFVFSDANDTSSAIVELSSGYTLKSGTRPGDGISAPDGSYTGLYYEDYEYSTTTLDSCNGRWGKTPDFPDGTYYYVLTDSYPYIPRCFKGTVVDNTFRVGPGASCPSSTASTDCSDGPVEGCTDPFSCNYNPDADINDGSCDYTYSYDTLTVASCGSYVAPSGTIHSASGIISDTLVVGGSCDTIYNITLTISGATSNRTITNPTSSGSNDGKIEFGPPTGMPPFEYSIDSGLTYSPSLPTAPPSPPAFTGLVEGDYWTVIKDGNNCEIFEQKTLSVALPIELSSFIATEYDRGIKLEWITASEINSSHFEIEQSIDGERWKIVENISAAGNSTQQRKYQWIDLNPENGLNYYRLRQVDLDGTWEYSEVVSILLKNTIENILIYPNPTRASFTVLLKNKSSFASLTNLELYNSSGSLVLQQDISESVINVPTTEFPSGIYFLKINQSGRIENFKIIITD